MKQVSQNEFYAAIGKLDCHPMPSGRYPYTSEFKTKDGRLVGKSVSYYTNPPNLWPVGVDYYLMEAQ
jgi:hypothetical protein